MNTLTPTEKLNILKDIKQYEQRSVLWFKQREGKLTSSDAATALGINPYQKPVELLFKKCGAGKPFEGNVATLYGQKYEDEAIGQYSKAMGKINHDFGLLVYDEVPRKPCPWYPDGIPWMAGSTDGIAEDVRGLEDLIVLEVKCPYRRKIIYGKCPDYYYPQVQLNMAILDINKADFIEYKPPLYGNPMELNIVRIHRDQEWFNTNVPIMDAFWKDVEYWQTQDITTHPEYEKYHKPPKKTLDLESGNILTTEPIRESMFLDSDTD